MSMEAPDSSYEPAFFSLLFEVEERHVWFRTRLRVIEAALTPHLSSMPRGYRVLEAGCGTGNVLRHLESICVGATVIGMDYYRDGLEYARQRVRCALVQGDMTCPPFQVQFDVLGLFDVIEHLPDDRAIMRDLYRLLRPDGLLIMTVPAHMSLWSYFDEASHHYRRYSRAEMASKLAAEGFEVTFLTEYMATLFPAVWLLRRLAELRARLFSGGRGRNSHAMASDELRIVPGVNGLLTALMQWEIWLIERGIALPIGSSLLVVARRKA